MLDVWIEQGEFHEIASEVVEQLRRCGQLVGASQDFLDDVNSQNFREKVLLVRQMRKLASMSSAQHFWRRESMRTLAIFDPRSRYSSSLLERVRLKVSKKSPSPKLHDWSAADSAHRD
jgi:hypothetical protein